MAFKTSDEFQYDKEGFNKDGFNLHGFDRSGLDRDGQPHESASDKPGWTVEEVHWALALAATAALALGMGIRFPEDKFEFLMCMVLVTPIMFLVVLLVTFPLGFVYFSLMDFLRYLNR